MNNEQRFNALESKIQDLQGAVNENCGWLVIAVYMVVMVGVILLVARLSGHRHPSQAERERQIGWARGRLTENYPKKLALSLGALAVIAICSLIAMVLIGRKEVLVTGGVMLAAALLQIWFPEEQYPDEQKQ